METTPFAPKCAWLKNHVLLFNGIDTPRVFISLADVDSVWRGWDGDLKLKALV